MHSGLIHQSFVFLILFFKKQSYHLHSSSKNRKILYFKHCNRLWNETHFFPFRNTQRLMHLPWIMKTTFRTWISRSDWSQLQGAGASQSTMEAPICLVQNWKEQLTVNPEAIRILEKISQPLVVVAIVGLYRTGKSYLMNRLAGQNHGECPSDAWRPFTWISGRW